MDIKAIYENIDINQVAEFQLKVKADFRHLNLILNGFSQLRITSETTDTDYQICMITTPCIKQKDLLRIFQLLLLNQLPIISMICIGVPKKTIRQVDDNQATASSRSA